MIFEHTYNLGDKVFILKKEKIEEVEIAKIVIDSNGKELYGYKLLNSTEYGFIDQIWSFKKHNSEYNGSYKESMLQLEDIFTSFEQIKKSIKEYVKTITIFRNCRKGNEAKIQNLEIIDKNYKIEHEEEYKIDQEVHIKSHGLIEICEICKINLLYLSVEENHKNLTYKVINKSKYAAEVSKEKIYTSLDDYYEERTNEIFNSYKILK